MLWVLLRDVRCFKVIAVVLYAGMQSLNIKINSSVDYKWSFSAKGTYLTFKFRLLSSFFAAILLPVHVRSESAALEDPESWMTVQNLHRHASEYIGVLFRPIEPFDKSILIPFSFSQKWKDDGPFLWNDHFRCVVAYTLRILADNNVYKNYVHTK